MTVTDLSIADTLVSGLSFETKTLLPGESTSRTYTYKVTQADVDAAAGKVINTATVTGKDPSGNDVTGSGTKEITTLNNPHLTVSKVTMGEKPENGYPLGSTITYKVTVTNDGNITIHDIVVSDDLAGVNLTDGSVEIETLAPGASADLYYEYVVTEADIEAGKVINNATSTGKTPDKKDGDEPNVIANPGTTEDPTESMNGALKVTKTADKSANVNVEEKITYTVKVENIGNVTIKDITFTDTLVGTAKLTKTELAPGESEEITYEYEVTQSDVDAGKIENTATAVGKNPKGGEVKGEASVTVTEEQKPELTVIKKTTSNPSHVSAYIAGEVITYEVKVENTGNCTINNIVVNDQLPDIELTSGDTRIASLAPKESKILTYKYVVTQADVKNGSVVNNVTAEGTKPGSTEKVPGNGTTTDPVKEYIVIKVTGNTAQYMYDGTNKSAAGYTVVSDSSFDSNKVVYGGEATVTRKNAGTYAMGLDKDKFSYSDENVIADFELVSDGELTITKRKLIFQSASDAKQYDGTPLTNHTVTVGYDGFAPGEGVTFYVTGSQTEIGSSENIFDYIWNNGTIASNYEFPNEGDNAHYGTLTVTERVTYKLTIHYVDENGNPLGEDFVAEYESGSNYARVTPAIDGYTPNKYIVSGTIYGDVEETVVYSKAGKGYTLTEIPENMVPLANRDGTHTDSIWTFLFMTVSIIMQFVYASKKKKYQERALELNEQILRSTH